MGMIDRVLSKIYVDKEISRLSTLVGILQMEVEQLKGGPITPPVDTTPPTNVSNLMPVSITIDSIDLSWSAATDNVGVIGYEVHQDGVLLNTVSGLSYRASGLDEDTNYTFTIKAKDVSSNVSSGVSITLKTSKAVTPDNVTGLSAINIADEGITLEWNLVQGVGLYEIYDEQQNIVGSTDGDFYDVEDLLPSTSYTFIVRSVSGTLTSVGTNISATTLSPPIGNEVAYLWVGGMEGE